MRFTATVLVIACVLFCASLAEAGIFTTSQINSQFTAFTKKFSKAFSATAVPAKLAAFTANIEFIAKFNAKAKKSYQLGVNKFTDLTASEFKKTHLGLKTDNMKSFLEAEAKAAAADAALLEQGEDADVDADVDAPNNKKDKKKKKEEEEAAKKKAAEEAAKPKKLTPYQEMIKRQEEAKAAEEALKKKRLSYPASLDWSKTINGYGAGEWAVKNQGSCGSCWAFAGVALAEATHAIATKTVLDASEQEVLDCASERSTCAGGYPGEGLNYIKDKGVSAESAYPYTKRRGACNTAPARSAIKLGKVTTIGRHEDAYIDALQTGPIAIGVSAEKTLQHYKSGIIDDCGPYVDHAVLLVGYGVSDGSGADGAANQGTKFYTIRNSWDKSWGEAGYFRVNRDKPTNSSKACATYNYMALTASIDA